ncbi:hypothetical protein FACS189491_02740 [Spirochaetia bacterium]|nr:hypothetical protein FACS189491_02740 [Spirochaetia bacterium]
MKAAIKKRIEAIRRGKVPEGYKKIKGMVYPDDWNFTKLSTFLEESKERNYSGNYKRENVLSVSGELGIVNQIGLLGRSYAGVSLANY